MSTQVGEVWSDLDHRLIQDAQGVLKKVINISAVMTSIDNIIRTSRGERVMLPDFASNLKSIVFESMGGPLMDLVSRDIKETIEKWDDRVTVTQVRYLAEPDSNSIALEIAFIIKGFYRVFKYETSIKGEVD